MSKIVALRAVTAHTARRILRIATIIVLAISAVFLLSIGTLAYFFSGWWWLLLLPFLLLLSILLTIRVVLLLIARGIHNGNVQPDQKEMLDDFVDKIEQLIEARGTPPLLFVLISVKDLLLHRDLTTIKKIIKDSVSLQRDFIKLEKLF